MKEKEERKKIVIKELIDRLLADPSGALATKLLYKYSNIFYSHELDEIWREAERLAYPPKYNAY